MKKIFFMIAIAILFGCTNQTNEEKKEINKDLSTDAAAVRENPEKGLQLTAEPEDDGTVSLSLGDENDNKAPAIDTEISVIFNKGTTAYANEDFAGGLKYFKEIISKHPENRKAYYNLGLGYFKLQQFNEALNAFSKAIEIIPNDNLSIQYRGRVYYTMGNYQKASEDYSRVVELKPNDPMAWYNRGTAFGAMKLYRKALEDFNKSIELDPDYAVAYFNRGLAHHFLGMAHEACVDWRKAHAMGHYEADKALKSYCEGD